jgi:hypothetical protein
LFKISTFEEVERGEKGLKGKIICSLSGSRRDSPPPPPE